MRKKMLSAFTAILLLSSATRAVAALKPYAAYFYDEKTLYFVYKDSQSSGVDQIIEGKTATKVFSIPSDDETFAGCEGAEDATRVVIESSFLDFKPKSCLNWFYGLCNVTEIKGLGNINTSSVITMSQMFRNCSSLTALDLTSFNTSSVTNMSGMFNGCSALTSLDLGDLTTEKVTTMRDMFNGCTSLTKLNLRKLNPAVIPDVGNMFANCNSLRTVDLSMSTLEPIDLRTIADQIPGTPLIFIPTETYVSGRANVVEGDECKNLVIGDTDAGYHQLLLSVPYSFTAKSVTVKRTFTADKPYTLYLPFAIDAAAYGTFYTGGELNEDGTIVCFSKLDAGQTEANTPYLFVPEKDYAEGLTLKGPVAVAVTAARTETDGLNGVYEKKVFSAGEVTRKLYYGWAGGEFRPALEGAVVDAGRAYFKLPASNASNAPATLKVRLGNDLPTGISDINCDAHATDSPAYNLNGQRVTDSYRGVVVRNGAKTLRR